MDFGMSVQELLGTKFLKDIAKVIAGDAGLSNKVRWVHVLEIRDVVKQSVNGNELVLTTGIGFTSKEVALQFVQELIDQHVSALCIETALYYHKVDDEVIELANRKGFPLIEISEISRFLDISKGLNTLLINNESQLYNNTDNYDSHLNDISSKGTLADGIKYTEEYLDIDVAYIPEKMNTQGISIELKNSVTLKIDALKKTLSDDGTFVKGNYAVKRIDFLGKTWGHLIFSSRKRDLSDYEILVLSRLSSKIKDDIYANTIANEKRLYSNNDWIKKWLDGSISEAEVKKRLQASGFHANFSEFVVCCTQYHQGKDPHDFEEKEASTRKYYEDFLMHSTITIRNIFEKEGFQTLGFMENETIYFIVMNTPAGEGMCEKIEFGIKKLRECKNQFMDYSNATFTIGKKVGRYADVGRSCDTAVKLISRPDNLPGVTIVFDYLYINRIMLAIEDNYVLRDYISDYLGDLLSPKNQELLGTLMVYLECNCSKQKTAEKLFVVRQTLYFRLQKIAEIIGVDFDKGEKRFAVEFAVHAYYYLKARSHEDVFTL